MTRTAPAAFSLVSNLVGLPGGSAKGLGHVGTAATDYVDDICSPIFFTTGASVGIAASVVILYVVTAEEILTPSVFTDGIDPDALTTQHTLIGNATIANAIAAIGGPNNPLAINTKYCFPGFSIISFLGYKPTFWAPLIWNRQGVGNALSATASGFYATHTLVT